MCISPSLEPDFNSPSIQSFDSTLPEIRLTTSSAINCPSLFNLGGGGNGSWAAVAESFVGDDDEVIAILLARDKANRARSEGV